MDSPWKKISTPKASNPEIGGLPRPDDFSLSKDREYELRFLENLRK